MQASHENSNWPQRSFEDALKRLDEIERYSKVNTESISKIADLYSEADKRLKRLEELAQSRAITEAREDERDKALYSRLDRIEKDVESIKGIGSKALWIFASAVIVAVATFLIKGGFA